MAMIYIPRVSNNESQAAGLPQEVSAHPAHELYNKPIINIQNGAKIGNLVDLLFDPETLQIAGLSISHANMRGLSSFFNRDTDTLPASAVQVWGKDVILVHSQEMVNEVKNPGAEKWVRLSNQLHGFPVVSTDGTRVGQVDDVLVDTRGRIAGYDLSQVYIDGPLKESKRIPIQATSSLGKDVLIVDMSKI